MRVITRIQIWPSVPGESNRTGIIVLLRRNIVSATICTLLVLVNLPAYSQEDSTLVSVDSMVYPTLSQKTKTNRQIFAGSLSAVTYGGSLILLDRAWYSKEARAPFHTFDDSKEWLQMDKVGHAWTAYNTARGASALWLWSGMSQKKAAWIGGLSGATYLTVIEWLDAHSAKWGWSWSDIAANVGGSGLFMAQELGWKEQRIQFKFSFHRKQYEGSQLNDRVDDLFGASWYERMLKDYNAQTQWLSVNVKSFFPQSNWPAWLNIAVGYGADGMFGGFDNTWTVGAAPGTIINRTDIPRTRQFYLAPDIDLTKIKTKSKVLRTAFSMLNVFKIPAPALMLDSKGKFKAYGIYF